MSSNFEIQRQFDQRSERVKCVDLHQTQPWVLLSLYSGNVTIWNYQSQVTEKSFKITEVPVRTAKFITDKEWFVAGSDDKFIRVYNYNTMEKITEFEAHTDYIRCLVVHPSLPYVISSSDDTLIKLWNWEKDWECAQIFKGHSHYVMQIAFNPNDTNTFASVSLDNKADIWNIGSAVPEIVLEGHSKGINTVDFFATGDKSYLVTGSDDKTAKVWDYKSGTCVCTLEGHEHNITAIYVHPEFPIIVTAAEDETVRIWNAKTFRLENTMRYGFGRVWAIGCVKNSEQIVIGCDQGAIIGKIKYSETKSYENLPISDDKED